MSLSSCIFEVLHANPTWRNPRPISTSSVWFHLGQLTIMSPIKSMDAGCNFLWQKPWDLFALMHYGAFKSISGSSASSRFTMEATILLQNQPQAVTDKLEISHCVEETLPPAKLATPQKALWPILSGNGLWGSPGTSREQERTSASSGTDDDNATCNVGQTSGISSSKLSCFAFWVHESYALTILMTEAFHVFQQKQIFGIPTTFSATAVFSHGFIGQHNPPRSRAIPAHFDPMALTHDACSVFFPQGILEGGASCGSNHFGMLSDF